MPPSPKTVDTPPTDPDPAGILPTCHTKGEWGYMGYRLVQIVRVEMGEVWEVTDGVASFGGRHTIYRLTLENKAIAEYVQTVRDAYFSFKLKDALHWPDLCEYLEGAAARLMAAYNRKDKQKIYDELWHDFEEVKAWMEAAPVSSFIQKEDRGRGPRIHRVTGVHLEG